jgi:hypothetical protein
MYPSTSSQQAEGDRPLNSGVELGHFPWVTPVQESATQHGLPSKEVRPGIWGVRRRKPSPSKPSSKR